MPGRGNRAEQGSVDLAEVRLAHLVLEVAGSDAVATEDYVEGFRNTALVDGSMYGLPWDGETTGPDYRATPTGSFKARGLVMAVSMAEAWFCCSFEASFRLGY